MSFTAEDIAHFDEYLSGIYWSEYIAFVFLVFFFTVIILLSIFLPDRYLYKNSRGDDVYLKKKSRYRNGRKIPRQEFEAENALKRKKRRRKNRIVRICVVVIFLGITIGFICISNRQLHDIRQDMDENAYLVYEGTFTCERYHNRGFDSYGIVFTDDSGQSITLNMDFWSVDTGTHAGRIVYSENSRYLIDLEYAETK